MPVIPASREAKAGESSLRLGWVTLMRSHLKTNEIKQNKTETGAFFSSRIGSKPGVVAQARNPRLGRWRYEDLKISNLRPAWAT
jgi:hypothetical protein